MGVNGVTSMDNTIPNLGLNVLVARHFAICNLFP